VAVNKVAWIPLYFWMCTSQRINITRL